LWEIEFGMKQEKITLVLRPSLRTIKNTISVTAVVKIMGIIGNGNVEKRIIFVKIYLKGNKEIILFGCTNEV
jgi:hypothetical protein